MVQQTVTSLQTGVLCLHSIRLNTKENNLRSFTVHVASIKSFICPTMHTNYYKIVKQLKSFKIIIVAPTCFGLHKPSLASSQPVFCQNYNVDIGYISLFEVIGIVAAYAATIPITSNNDM